MRPLVRSLAVLSAVASALGVLATASWAQQRDGLTATILIAMTWAAAVAAVDAVIVWRDSPATRLWAASRGRASVTFVVRLGEERVDIARASIALAARAGSVIVVATRHHAMLDDLGDVDVHEHIAPTIAEALRDAVLTITTDAVLVLSASAFPLGDACETAAALLSGRVGWVIGTAPAFNNDRFAPGERELISARTRTAAREFGLVTWEPDATIVRTSLLRSFPLEPGRPDGRWLRSRAADDWYGVTFAEPLAVRAAPADAPVFWATETRRQRGVAADLADATLHGAFGARLIAGGILLRELYAYPMAMWLFAFVLIGRNATLPLSVSPVTFFAIVGALAVVRWTSSRLAFGVGVHPIDEARGAAYGLPASVLALPEAVARRVRWLPFGVPDEPLLWVALVLTLVTTIPLLDRRRPVGGAAVGVGAGLALAALAATWLFALRSFGTRGWDRSTYRVPIDVPATIDGGPARTTDASPRGLGVIGTSLTLESGEPVAVSVRFTRSSELRVRGRVTHVRQADHRRAAGVALDLDGRERVAWVRAVFAAAGLTAGARTVPVMTTAPRIHYDRNPTTIRRRLVVGFHVGAVAAISALVGVALLLAFLGYQPMVVRSGSMVPRLGIGDVVIADWIPVEQIHRGEIVTFNSAIGVSGTVTHRVQTVSVSGDVVNVVTKGDANAGSEQWSARRGTLVGQVVLTVPRVGEVLVVLGASTARTLLLAASGAIALLAALDAARRRAVRRRLAPHA